MAGYICKIVIEGTHPPVWRRVVIPDRTTFLELHEIIQILFGWEDDHLHAFSIPSDRIYIADESDMSGMSYGESETLVDPFFRNYKWIRYTYDFGDDWRHKINIEKMDENYTERYAALLKYKGDNFLEDCGIFENLDDDVRSVFDKENVENQLKSLAFPAHEDLQEVRLLKESLNEFQNMIQNFIGLKPEIQNSVMTETLQKIDNTASPMAVRIEEWKAFAKDKLKNGDALQLCLSPKPQQELLMALGEKEAADYYKYLRLPSIKLLTREEKVYAVSKELQDHPEYLLYVFDEEEYCDLTEWIRYTKGIVSNRPQNTGVMIKVIGLGLGDFVRKEDYGEICFASDIDKYVGAVDAKTKKKTYRELNRFDEKMGNLIQMYGMIELESLYGIYQKMYGKNWEKESFFRCIYWHARYNAFVNTVYQLDGSCYVVSRELDPNKIIGKIKDYAEELSYAEYSVRETEYKGKDLANRSEWMESLFIMLHYRLEIDMCDVQDYMTAIVSAIMNGDTVDQIMQMLETESDRTWSLEDTAEMWKDISGVMLDLELPMLKGRCRKRYAKERGCSAWKVGMVSDAADIKDTKTHHIYQFPAEVQEWMYEAGCYGLDDSIKQLFAYKERNHICSEEYLYLLSEICIVFGETKRAEKLIVELKTSSSQGRKAAKHLERQLEERYEVVDDDEDWYEPGYDGWNWNDQIEVQQPYVRTAPKIGQNDPCPCGSGKKYKKCCGR